MNKIVAGFALPGFERGHVPVRCLAGLFFLAAAGWSVSGNAQNWTPPADEERCPSRWGASDERGSANHMGPATVMRAAQLMLVVNGIHLLERLKLDELVGRGVHEFALVLQPLKIEGATGSTVAPSAIW